jgi:hypothetical protein
VCKGKVGEVRRRVEGEMRGRDRRRRMGEE